MKQLIEPVRPAQKIQRPKKRLQAGGLGILRPGSRLGRGVGMGIFTPAIKGKLFLRQVGTQKLGIFCLGRGFYHIHRVPVKLQHRLISLGAQIGPAQQLIHPVPHMGQAQVGDGIHLLHRKIHFEEVFHRSFPRFTNTWAHRPVKPPDRMLHPSITGR